MFYAFPVVSSAMENCSWEGKHAPHRETLSVLPSTCLSLSIGLYFFYELTLFLDNFILTYGAFCLLLSHRSSLSHRLSEAPYRSLFRVSFCFILWAAEFSRAILTTTGLRSSTGSWLGIHCWVYAVVYTTEKNEHSPPKKSISRPMSSLEG